MCSIIGNINTLVHKYYIVNNFVDVRLILGSQLTCHPDQKSCMADCIIFRF